MAAPDKASLIGHWIHSHEEDNEGEQVYRRQGYAFPRARGRAAFELGADHAWVDRPIAAADGNDRVDGRWELKPSGELQLQRTGTGGKKRVLRVMSVEPDRMVVKEEP